jgi:hypothetical protein
MKNLLIGIAVIVLVVIFGAVLYKNPGTPVSGALDDFATCLGDKGAKFYGAFWCPHCQAQKALFGASVKKLPYVECSTLDGKGQTQVCIDAKIVSYPTWEFADGSRLTGETPLATLAEKTSCPLPEGERTTATTTTTGESSSATGA